MRPDGQEVVWEKVKYRGPEDFVVRSYALPKLDLIESVLPLRGCSVLDVGCGPGLMSTHLLPRARWVVGTDISRTMLRRSQGMEAVLADALNLPFAAASFDLVFEANLLHHTDHPLNVLLEMARVARKAVVLIEPNRNNPLMFAFLAITAHERGGLKFSRRYLEGLLQQADLVPKRFWTSGMITQNSTPKCLVPLLKIFDFDFPLGEYHVTVALKPPGENQ
jgi:SAM-dependent methyltransferase